MGCQLQQGFGGASAPPPELNLARPLFGVDSLGVFIAHAGSEAQLAVAEMV